MNADTNPQSANDWLSLYRSESKMQEQKEARKKERSFCRNHKLDRETSGPSVTKPCNPMAGGREI
jgi:hypothetical protein